MATGAGAFRWAMLAADIADEPMPPAEPGISWRACRYSIRMPGCWPIAGPCSPWIAEGLQREIPSCWFSGLPNIGYRHGAVAAQRGKFLGGCATIRRGDQAHPS